MTQFIAQCLEFNADNTILAGLMLCLVQYLAAGWGGVVVGVCKLLIINSSIKWHGRC
jgi:hypothetical protein